MKLLKWLLTLVKLTARTLVGLGLSEDTQPESKRRSLIINLLPLLCLLCLAYFGAFFHTYTLFASLVIAVISVALMIPGYKLCHAIVGQRYPSLPFLLGALASITFNPFHPVLLSEWVLGTLCGWFLAGAASRDNSGDDSMVLQFASLTFCFWFVVNGIWHTDLGTVNLISIGLNLAISVFYGYNLRILVNKTKK